MLHYIHVNGLLSAAVGAILILAAAASPTARNETAQGSATTDVPSQMFTGAVVGSQRPTDAGQRSGLSYYHYLVPGDYVPVFWDDDRLESTSDLLPRERVGVIRSPEDEAEHLAVIQQLTERRAAWGLPPAIVVDLR